MLIDRPLSYEDMASRERFRAVLNQKEHALDDVLTDYSFTKLCQCGLSDCRTPHNEGFLVVTTDGLETNVGRVCGKKAFPEFESKRADYLAKRERSDLLARGATIKALRPQIEGRVSEILDAKFGLRWVRDVRAALCRVLGDDLFDSLSVGQRRGDLRVQHVRQRSGAEVAMIVQNTRQRPEQVRTATETIGHLEPMSWLVYDFHGVLRTGLLSQLDRFENLDLNSLATPQLRREVKIFDGYERTLDDAAAATASTHRFFTPENLELLRLWVPERLPRRRESVANWAGSAAQQRLAEGA